MKLPQSSIQKTKIGTCPHGLPQGACPICSGMGGGGGGGAKKAEKPSGEMSWDECFAVGQMLKAQQLAQLQRKNEAIQGQMISQYKMQINLGSMAQKMTDLAERLTNFVQRTQSTSSIFSKTLALGAKLAIPTLNVLKNTALLAQKAMTFAKEKLADISDKLNAMFGELKNATEKKISDRLKDFKKKIKSFFGITEPEDVDDEEKKIEEEKRIFELKTFIHTLKEKFTNKKEEKE